MSKKILKRSLALGALMAFVITGNAWAAEVIIGADHNLPGYENILIRDTDGGYNYNKLYDKRKAGTNQGGACYNNNVNLTVKNCTFIGNTAKDGGAIANVGGNLAVEYCHFEGNDATKKGVAIFISNGSAKISNSVFKEHLNKSGNSVIYVAGNKTDVILTDNTFSNNGEMAVNVDATCKVTLMGKNNFTGNENSVIYNKGEVEFYSGSETVFKDNYLEGYGDQIRDISNKGTGTVKIGSGAIVESHSGINSEGEFELDGTLKAGGTNSYTFKKLSGANGKFVFLNNVDVDVVENTSNDLSFHATKEVTNDVGGDFSKVIGDSFASNGSDDRVKFSMDAGDIVGYTEGELYAVADDSGKYFYAVDEDSVDEKPHEGNAAISHNANIAMMAWRAETNDMNKRLGELRNANGDLGVWVRMVGGEDEFKSVEYEYTQYQLGYDEKLSVDPSWTVGVALSYTDGESKFTDGSGENTHKGLSVYGSKLNDDGSFIDLIAKYSRLEHDLISNGDKGDYSTNGYSVSAEYGKRFQQGKGLWIEPQVELTYGKVKSAEYKLGDKTVSQDAMESLVGRIGFSLGKDIKQGNVYARASYLYDFEGETNMAFANSGARREFKYDLGGGWWEVGVGANVNLSKATYIYADVEKTFGGEVDTNWQWNLGVRYSF